MVDSVESIARGNISAAVGFVESSTANTLPAILGFLARLVGLGNVTGHVRTVIGRIQAKITTALERVARWVADHLKGLKDLVVGTAASVKQGITRPWRGIRQNFSFGDEQHALIATPGPAFRS